MTDTTVQDSELGPIDYLVVEFPVGSRSSDGFQALVDLVDRGVIRILDLEFVAKDSAGSIRAVTAAELTASGEFDVAVFAGASSGLLDPSDIEGAGRNLSAGSTAAILIYEELSLIPVLAAWTAGGAVPLAAGPVDPDDLVEALDAEPSA
jgi:hypothetical protein